MEEVLEVDDVNVVSVEPSEPEPPTLNAKELADLQVSQFQVRAYEAEMQLEIIKKDAYLQQIDPSGRLNQMLAAIRSKSNNLAEAKTFYRDTVTAIETRLGVNLKEWAYNDQNGVLSKVSE